MNFTTTSNTSVALDVSIETCAQHGFKPNDIFIRPDKMEAIIRGVGPNPENLNEDVPWYEIVHSATVGKVCCHALGSLEKAGFVKKELAV